MRLEELIMICICDYAGQVRGKGFPAADIAERLAGGIGLAPTNLMITAFGDIRETPWGPRGELIMLPDPDTGVTLDLGSDRPPERFYLADLVELDGAPWPCCPRDFARRAVATLEAEAGLVLRGAFEHEFHYSGAAERLGDAYSLDSVRLQGTFASALLAALRENGIVPELFLPEYGPQQFEVTCRATTGLAIADQAVRLREIVRGVARAMGERACFSPVMAAGAVGNGVHLHFSLEDAEGKPLTYDAEGRGRISATAAPFVAGVLRDLPDLVALTAPSLVSYERLQPHRWSATWNNLGAEDREAGVRISPLYELPRPDPERRFNLEVRAGDAAASPYLALGAILWAGVQGIRDGLALPEPTSADPETMSEAERAARGMVRLPRSLPEALDRLAANGRVREWMGDDLLNAYLAHKRSELAVLEGLPLEAEVERYVQVY